MIDFDETALYASYTPKEKLRYRFVRFWTFYRIRHDLLGKPVDKSTRQVKRIALEVLTAAYKRFVEEL